MALKENEHMKSFVRAYLDDYDKITIIVNKTFCEGKSNDFYLLDESHAFSMSLIDVSEEEDKFVYHLQNNRDIEIGKQYGVMIANAYQVELLYRFVVKTKRFNDEFYYDGDDLGATLTSEGTSFALWAPTANQVKIELIQNGELVTANMQRSEKGVYRITFKENMEGVTYRYFVSVNGMWNCLTDPYGKASTPNGRKSVVVDLNKYKANKISLPYFGSNKDAIIYETSVRDYTKEGNFLAMSNELDYLQELGITHVQLMPVNDFGSVDELHPKLFYNWGYDPVQYQCLEGSYSSNVNEPTVVLSDFKHLVESLHHKGIRVNLDVVFNHVYAIEASTLGLAVPYYYFRYNADGTLSNGSYCGNDVDSQMPMARKLIVDTVKYYVNEFDVDGYRFDLMGLLDIDTITTLHKELKAIKEDIMIYGEGWNMETNMVFEDRACKENHAKLPDIGFFNDNFRDSIKGSPFEVESKGYGAGDFNVIDRAIGALRGLNYDDPNKTVNYIECHDDMTVFDKLKVCCKNESEATRIKRQKLLIGCVLLSQGIAFIHSGQEYCRSKKGISNSYNSPDSINKLKPKDKEIYKEVVDFTKKIIEIRKKYGISKNREEILRDVNFFKVSNAIGCEISNCTDNTTITYIINPTNNTITYNFSGNKKDLLKNEPVSSNIEVEPVSITVLGS